MNVVVLMSTYNGSNYVEEQIESIMRQRGVSIYLIVRDDGSTDGTVKILKQLEKKYNNIKVICEENIGVYDSFRRLIEYAPSCEYYAYADQDDIWYLDKLEIAVEQLKKNSKQSVLYVGNQNCIDFKGKYLYTRLPDVFVQENAISTLFQNQYSGCTMVFNKNLMKEIRVLYLNMDKQLKIMHDVCTLITAQLVGKVIYDAVPHMDFRRHGNNYTESMLYENMSLKKKIEMILHKIKTYFSKKGERGCVKKFIVAINKSFKNEMGQQDREELEVLYTYDKNIGTWIKSIFRNKLEIYFPKPKWNVRLKFLLKVY